MSKEKLLPLDPKEALGVERHQMPKHVAIIMDGNGRWAKQRGQARIMGHQAGSATVDRLSTVSAQLGIEQLTLYAFSTENWKRSPDEVNFLMGLYSAFLDTQRERIRVNGLRFRQIGRQENLPVDVNRKFREVEAESAAGTGMILCACIDYGSRQEITDAVRQLCADAAAGKLDPDQIDEQTISDALYTEGMSDPDLMIRTAGEMRLSNFLLWQLSYAELYVTDILFPDFSNEDYFAALRAYAQRNRRFGAETTEIGFGVGDDAS